MCLCMCNRKRDYSVCVWGGFCKPVCVIVREEERYAFLVSMCDCVYLRDT